MSELPPGPEAPAPSPDETGTRRALVSLVALAAALRCVRLTALPMFVDEAIHLYWSGRLLHEGYLTRPLGDGKPLPIIPGMTATVDVLTGHKTVLDYILKPLLKARQSALRER